MSEDRLDAVLDRLLAECLPDNVGLMHLLMAARSEGDARTALTRRLGREPASTPATERVEGLLRSLDKLPSAFATVKAVVAEADHASGTAPRTPAEWAAVFDLLARAAPEAGVALYGLGSPELLADATAEVVDRMAEWGFLRPTRRLLDIGCGIGRLALALAPHVGEVVGTDISPAMVAEAERRAAGVANVRFRVTDGRALDGLADAAFDTVLAADVFPYLVTSGEPLAERHVAEVARVLKPAGAALVLNYSYRGDPAQDRAELADAFRRNGLDLVVAGERPFRLWDAVVWLGRKPG